MGFVRNEATINVVIREALVSPNSDSQPQTLTVSNVYQEAGSVSFTVGDKVVTANGNELLVAVKNALNATAE